MKPLYLIGGLTLYMLSLGTMAATIDGTLDPAEYQWNTNGIEGSSKWNSYSGGYQEHHDAYGGSSWDINFLGIQIQDNKFQFGINGGYIISGRETGHDIFLGDIALDVGGDSTDPTMSSSGFDYAVRLLSVNHVSGQAEFALLYGGTWLGSDMSAEFGPQHVTETYRMADDATQLATFVGSWFYTGNDNTLEAEFDLSLLGLFDQNFGGVIGAYLTMSCVNDEALVYADVAPVPVPATFWLLSSALLGFFGLRARRHKV